VETPPLRQRREDLPLLCTHFLKVFATEMGMTPPGIDPSAMAMLNRHTFPGNVRELKNVMERALILSGGKTVRTEHLQLVMPATTTSVITVTTPTSFTAQADSVPLNLDEAEHTLIRRALEQTGGNVTEAARLLNVNRSRIYRRMPKEGQ
jgi:DNA-binding NtrC family response regulator